MQNQSQSRQQPKLYTRPTSEDQIAFMEALNKAEAERQVPKPILVAAKLIGIENIQLKSFVLNSATRPDYAVHIHTDVQIWISGRPRFIGFRSEDIKPSELSPGLIKRQELRAMSSILDHMEDMSDKAWDIQVKRLKAA